MHYPSLRICWLTSLPLRLRDMKPGPYRDTIVERHLLGINRGARVAPGGLRWAFR